MKLLLENHRTQMKANFLDETVSHAPVVKLFCPWGAATWLLYALPPDDPDMLLGLCDLGLGFPELGYVSLTELESLRGPMGLRIERDLHFTPKATIDVYAKASRLNEGIVEDAEALRSAYEGLKAEANRTRRTLKARLL